MGKTAKGGGRRVKQKDMRASMKLDTGELKGAGLGFCKGLDGDDEQGRKRFWVCCKGRGGTGLKGRRR